MLCLCSFGNMMTYLTSYMRQHGSPALTYGDFIVVQSVWGVTQGLVMPLSGYISRYNTKTLVLVVSLWILLRHGLPPILTVFYKHSL